MSNCIQPFNYSGQSYLHNFCYDAVTVEVTNSSYFTKNSLLELSKSCFDAYEFRLKEHSELMHKVGVREYEIINNSLIALTLPFEPLKFSFSITSDPSLHFFIRFEKNISLFVETFLDLEDGHDTFVQIFKSNHSLLRSNYFFDDALAEIKEVLESEFAGKDKIYYGI